MFANVHMEDIMDEVEHHFIKQLTALLSVPVAEGYIPGTLKTWAEQEAELVCDLLSNLQAYRRKRFQSDEKIYPKN